MRIGNDFYTASMSQRQSIPAQNKGVTRNFTSLDIISRDTISFGRAKLNTEDVESSDLEARFKSKKKELLKLASGDEHTINKKLTMKYAKEICKDYSDIPELTESELEAFGNIVAIYSEYNDYLNGLTEKDNVHCKYRTEYGHATFPIRHYKHPFLAARQTLKWNEETDNSNLIKLLLLKADMEGQVELHCCNIARFKTVCNRFKNDKEFIETILLHENNAGSSSLDISNKDVFFEIFKDDPKFLKKFCDLGYCES